MLGKADRTELHQEKSQHFNNGLEVSGIRVFSDSCQLSQIKKHLKGSSLSVLKRHLKPIGANTMYRTCWETLCTSRGSKKLR